MDNIKKDLLYNELDRGERILWSGEPTPKAFAGGSIVTFIFGIFFFAFSLFWITTAFSMNTMGGFSPSPMGIIFPLFGIPFVLAGFFMLLSPAFNYKSMKNSSYAITNKRCIIIKGFRALKTTSYPLDTISNIEKIQHPDGTGNLIFFKEFRTAYRDGRRRSYTNSIGFINVENVSSVERTLKSALNSDGQYGSNTQPHSDLPDTRF